MGEETLHFCAEIARGAVQRDLDRELPFEAFRLFRALGLRTLRIPVAFGGPGGSVSDYIEMIATIAAADCKLADCVSACKI